MVLSNHAEPVPRLDYQQWWHSKSKTACSRPTPTRGGLPRCDRVVTAKYFQQSNEWMAFWFRIMCGLRSHLIYRWPLIFVIRFFHPLNEFCVIHKISESPYGRYSFITSPLKQNVSLGSRISHGEPNGGMRWKKIISQRMEEFHIMIDHQMGVSWLGTRQFHGLEQDKLRNGYNDEIENYVSYDGKRSLRRIQRKQSVPITLTVRLNCIIKI